MEAVSLKQAGDKTVGTSAFEGVGAGMLCPHDLLWIEDAKALTTLTPLPSWASADRLLLLRAPVVVRREKVGDPRLVPVGLRGKTRSERFAAYLDRNAVARCIRPEMMVEHAPAHIEEQRSRLPAFEALAVLAPALDAIGLPWGPTGGVGFQLASRLPVVREDSDLDILLRSRTPLSAEQMLGLRTICSSPICRIDIQIDTGHGAFSFCEWAKVNAQWANGNGRVLLKTDAGPVLTTDPWRTNNWQDATSVNPS
ncbi:malonate decarboxylase holo-ACP synthase [Collimonas sp.]|jgi:phosphoribosyl-dephospho-CoA transferase|uniref:malonate decarboxylase holo-ACP synthase n=1 Tax=Collimonas sp. TaxID=1963772 RepID=UPI002C99323C|nr:malonate decarboxylase holo-ACP synthase [Collimonas sp.]HWW08267.1 malonate decarboxylase holo-ACP synthase [Collimonas sp.]